MRQQSPTPHSVSSRLAAWLMSRIVALGPRRLRRYAVSWSASLLIVPGCVFVTSQMLVPSHRVSSPPIGQDDPPVVVIVDTELPPEKPKPEIKPESAPVTKPIDVNATPAIEQPAPQDVAQHEPPPQIETALSAPPTVDDPFETDSELQDAALAATAVEPEPKPIEEMTIDEVLDQVGNYREWCEQGQVSIFLETEQLSSEQIDSLVAVYELRDPARTVFVDRAGRRLTVDEAAQRAGFEGDLSRRSRWPNRLRSEAERQFGGNHAAKAKFLLAPRPTLVLYRLLGETLGTEAPPPGTCVTLRLVPGRDGGVIGEVIEVLRPRTAKR